MIITEDLLERFEACKYKAEEFASRYSDGLDVSGLWGERERGAVPSLPEPQVIIDGDWEEIDE